MNTAEIIYTVFLVTMAVLSLPLLIALVTKPKQNLKQKAEIEGNNR